MNDQTVIGSPAVGTSRELSQEVMTDLMAEADSYHRFWIEERQRRLVFEAALKSIASIANQYSGGDWDEIEQARKIARAALSAAKGEA